MKPLLTLLLGAALTAFAGVPLIIGNSADCLRNPVASADIRDRVRSEEDAEKIREMEELRRRGHASVSTPKDVQGSICGDSQGR